MESKVCTKCGIDKELSCFYKKTSAKDGKQSICKDCRKLVDAESYKNNTNRKLSIRKRSKECVDYNKKLIAEKKKCGCMFCGEKEPIALDFHHLNSSEKEYNIGKLITYSTNKILKELEKCIVLCANCHRKVHANILQIK